MSARFLILLSLILTLFSCEKNKVELISPSIIPAPQSFEVIEGFFTLDNSVAFEFDPEFTESGTFINNYLKNAGFNLKEENKEQGYIYIKWNDQIKNPEGYRLKIDEKRILIHAKTDAGAFYAVQSLIQLLPLSNDNDEIHIPAVTIKDQPRFAYRGMHLDVSRHMFDVEFIKKYIDAMAMLKMNNFHWHLTDDQGWRIEIKKYPRLQEVAAYRDSTLLGHYNNTPHQYDGKKYGGYYTQEDVREVIAFAKARHINVIPEIELPGHAQAAIAAYPELGCTAENVQVAMKWGVFDNIYCPNEKTFAFLEDVLDEVVELFPSKYIHIGGDEAPKTQWKNSPIAQQVIKENGLKDEHELQSYFIQRIEKHLNSKGRQIIGWDEILEGGLAPNATVMSWRGTKGAVEAAKASHDVIMTPTSHAYFDYYQSENENEPLAIGGFLPLEKVYNFNPIPEELNQTESKFIKGVQGNVWTEYMKTSDQVEYMAFPRMLAMSEVAWSPEENRNYEEFVNRLEYFHERMDALDINYANHLYEIEGKLNSNQAYELSTKTLGKEIRFTTDESEPKLSSTVYESPIPFTADMTLKAAVFNDNEQLGSVFTQEFIFHKGVGATIRINKEPHKSYAGSGAAGLINGIKGSDSRYGDREWLGFWGEDVEIEIEFETEVEINEIELRFYHAPGQWIYAPETTTLFIVTTEKAGIAKTVELNKNSNTSLVKSVICVKDATYSRKSKYLEISIPNYGTIPDGQQGAGNKAWTFIDEIIIK